MGPLRFAESIFEKREKFLIADPMVDGTMRYDVFLCGTCQHASTGSNIEEKNIHTTSISLLVGSFLEVTSNQQRANKRRKQFYNTIMALPDISIIIPTRNRPQILRRCLDHCERQTIRDQLEVIVVIDGEDPKTAEMLAGLRWSFPLTCFAIPKTQQGVARNRGVAHARGEIVLFIGDDIFLAADACERHLSSSDFRSAVLGFTTWDPAVGITPVMRWLEKTGWQFGYARIAEWAGKSLPPDIQHRFTYTSNISLPKETALRLPFREDVTLYGWEDVEWGIRLRDAGIPLFFEPTAGALHHHYLALEDSLKRMVLLGQAAQVFAKIHPGFDRVPRRGKLLLYHCCALLPTLRGRHAKAFLKGLRKG